MTEKRARCLWEGRWARLKGELESMMDEIQADLRYQDDSSTQYLLTRQTVLRTIIRLLATMHQLEREEQ